ncbi:MAG: hypothetical protein DRN66_01470 [Candidatus Nanohalarchaeota archaeon]|nr:MAG: hypothetical protein DRN66_01470 [Candidatus Nanohaloarchaeota archaeon]
MDEKKTIKLLLILAICGIAINAYSVFVQAGMMPIVFMNYILPAGCIEQNSTYFLSQPTDASFCRRIMDMDSNFNKVDLKDTCNEMNSEEDKELCILMSDFYSKRVDDCSDYIVAFNYSGGKESSVSDDEMKKVCDRINARAP